MSILKGRQIFSHLEGKESLPSLLYDKAIRKATLLRKGIKLNSPYLSLIDSNFGIQDKEPILIKRNLPKNSKYNNDESWKDNNSKSIDLNFEDFYSDESKKQKSKRPKKIETIKLKLKIK